MEAKLDCGDNSCEFAENKTGMRTNGGCRCLKNLDFTRRMAARGYIKALREENARLKADIDARIALTHDHLDKLTLREGELNEARRELAQRNREWCEAIDKAGALTRERDEARARVAHLDSMVDAGGVVANAAATKRAEAAEAEIARKDGLILAWEGFKDGCNADLLAEAKRIRAQREEPRCVRCGAPYAASGCCSRRSQGCQGGRSEAQREEVK